MNPCTCIAVICVMAAPALATVINFDTDASGNAIVPPKLFRDTVALRDSYSSLGVHFMGPGEKHGGGIVNRVTGVWSLPELSGQGIMGFHSGSSYSDGGIPLDPQTITFDWEMSRVSIWAASTAGKAFKMSAFSEDGILVGTVSTTLTTTWQHLVIEQSGIHRIEWDGVAGIYAIDNLEFVPAPGSVLLFAGAGVHLARRRRCRAS